MYLKKISAFLLLSLSACAFAEEQTGYKPGQYYFAPGIAYYHFSEKRDLQNTALADLSVGLAITEQLSLEALYGQASTESTPTQQNNNSVRFYTYWMDGVYHFQSAEQTNFHPYVLAGLGITNQDNATSSSSGNSSLVGVNAGAGVEYFVSPSISVYTDVRDIYTLSGGKDDWMLNAGVKFLFGDSAKAAENTEKPIETSGATGFYQLQDSSQK